LSPHQMVRFGLAVAACASALSAFRAPQTASLIERYSKATCLPVTLNLSYGPPTREWEDSLKLGDGSQITVSGAQMPGGRIDVLYKATGRSVVAANPGDYVYPTDVRVSGDILFVRASGLAVGPFGAHPRTDLFEYDLKQNRLLNYQKVSAIKLPDECPVTKTIPRR
jgi:hypothetical protein